MTGSALFTVKRLNELESGGLDCNSTEEDIMGRAGKKKTLLKRTPIDHFRQEVAYIGSIVGCTLQARRVTLVPIHTGLRVIYVLIRPTTSTVVSFERVVRIH